MSLDGLRAWVAEVERKLAKRTRVFLALTVIAIGIASAAVYLAIDARNSSVSEGDVQALQEELEERIDGGGAVLTPPVEPAPETTPAPAQEPSPKQGNGGGNGGGGGSGSGGGASSGGGAGAGGPDSAKLQELLEQAQQRSAEGE